MRYRQGHIRCSCCTTLPVTGPRPTPPAWSLLLWGGGLLAAAPAAAASPPRPAGASADRAGKCHQRMPPLRPGVGDTVAQARMAGAKRLGATPHPYLARRRVLTVDSTGRQHALVVEPNGLGRIATLRSGRLPEAGWLEGDR